ncbi:hypothetical protein [Prescottella subtropica]|nr:hypothetical protein [Prescottella subtropica]
MGSEDFAAAAGSVDFDQLIAGAEAVGAFAGLVAAVGAFAALLK